MTKAKLEYPGEDVIAVQLQDINLHWLKLAMLAGDDSM